MILRFILPMLLMSFMASAAPAHVNPDIDFMKKIESAFTQIAEGVQAQEPVLSAAHPASQPAAVKETPCRFTLEYLPRITLCVLEPTL